MRAKARQNLNQNNMAAHAYKLGELFRRLHLQNVQQSEENQGYSGIVSEEDPMESHTSTVNNFTTQQCLVTSPRDPGVVSLHVDAGHFSTTAWRVTSPTWGPPPPCKQALKKTIVACSFRCGTGTIRARQYASAFNAASTMRRARTAREMTFSVNYMVHCIIHIY